MLLGTVVIGLVWAYWPTLERVAGRWAVDARYSHGYVVPVFAFIVLWFRRDRFPSGSLRPAWWGLALVGTGTALRLFGGYFYFQWFEAVSLLPTLAGLCVLVGGWPLLRWAWPAIAFLLFLVPLPDRVENGFSQPLQQLATAASTYALQTLGVPAVSQGNVIHIEDLEIGVVEACSGLGMLFTFFALSTAVAFIIRRPVRDKVVIFLSAIPIGVLMNLLRITITGVLFSTAGADVARVVFHDLAGWLMMPLALGVLWLELRFLARLYVPMEPTGPVPVALPQRVRTGEGRSTRPGLTKTATERAPLPGADHSLLEIP
jgi:exosortase